MQPQKIIVLIMYADDTTLISTRLVIPIDLQKLETTLVTKLLKLQLDFIVIN